MTRKIARKSLFLTLVTVMVLMLTLGALATGAYATTGDSPANATSLNDVGPVFTTNLFPLGQLFGAYYFKVLLGAGDTLQADFLSSPSVAAGAYIGDPMSPVWVSSGHSRLTYVAASEGMYTVVVQASSVGAFTVLPAILSPGTLSGRVTAPGGAALAGAVVTLSDGRGSATADPSGNYTIAGVPVGTYVATFAKVGYGTRATNITIGSGDAHVTDMELAVLSGTLSGHVTVSGSGGALAGVTVALSGAGRSATTDASGNYTISGVPAGTYTATFSKAGYGSKTASVTIFGDDTQTANMDMATLIGTLSGHVTYPSGSLANVTVTLSDGGGSSKTDSSGNYTISGILPGVYTVTFSKTNYTTKTSSITITGIGTQYLDMALAVAPPTGTLNGHVTDSGGSALSSVTVTLSSGGGSATTDGSGNYTISGIAANSYTVTFSKTGYGTKTSAVTFAGGDTKTADNTLSALTGTLNGHVTDSGGSALSSVTVTLSSGGGSAATDGSGNYTISGIAANSYTVTFSKTGYGTKTSAVTFAGGDTQVADAALTAYPDQVTLVYWHTAGGSIEGSETQVIAYGSSGTLVRARADAGFHFVRWSDTNSTNPERLDTNVNGDRVATAIFDQDPIPTTITSLSISSSRRGVRATYTAHLSPQGALGSARMILFHQETRKVRIKRSGKWRTVSQTYWHARANLLMSAALQATYKPAYKGKWKAAVTFTGTAPYTSSTYSRTFTVR